MSTKTVHNAAFESRQSPCPDLVAAARKLEHWWNSFPENPGGSDLPARHLKFPLLARLQKKFALNPFEANVVLLLGMIEVDPTATSRMPVTTSGRGTAGGTVITPAHFAALFPSDYDPSSLLEGSPLREWELVRFQPSRIESIPLPHRQISLCPRILNFLMGRAIIDPRLAAFLELETPEPILTPAQLDTAQNIQDRLRSTPHFQAHTPLQLTCSEPDTLLSIAVHACQGAGLILRTLRTRHLPEDPRENRNLMRLWEKEALLSDSALFLDGSDLTNNSVATESLKEWIRLCHGAVLVGGRSSVQTETPTIHLPVPVTTAADRFQMVNSLIGENEPGESTFAGTLAEQFQLSASAIWQSCQRAHLASAGNSDLAGMLWRECREQARPKSGNLTQVVQSKVNWEDLVLPEASLNNLRELTSQVRFRRQVHDDWGFADKGRRGLNLTALFSGPSGTGKTLAAEVISNDLQLNLLRVDLSSVVSKYIGETEKNLQQVFDSAESGGSILLFDEADALFGPRSKVNDSKDRNANIEVSYLLQRLEAFGGLALLTTNFKENIDPAFLRRIRFHIDFPFPDRITRSQIWRTVFPPSTPLENIDFDRLGRLSLTGGHIRNIALNAAFLAAAQDSPVRHPHIAEAARNEFRKMEKPSPEAELRFLLNIPKTT